MIREKERYLKLAFLLVFLFVSLFIHYFHTEKTLNGKDNCPACNFQNSSLATGQVHFFFIPDLVLCHVIRPDEPSHLIEILKSSSFSRSPPLV